MNQQMVYPIAPFSSPGKDDVCYWENFLTPEDINLILGRPEWHAFNEARVGGGTGGVNDPNVRRTNISWMGVDQQNQHVWEKITTAIVTGKDRKSTRLNSSHSAKSRMPSSA